MMPRLRVLIVEDSEENACLILDELRRDGYDPVLQLVNTAEEMTSAFESGTWDLVLSGHQMDGFSALDALNIAREKDVDVPFIVVSNTVGEDGGAVSAIKAGAHDCITWNNLARLSVIVERELSNAEIRRAHKRAEQALRLSEERFSAIFENAADCIFMKDQSLKYIEINPAMVGLLGVPTYEVVGKTEEELIPKAEEGQHVNGIDRRVLKGETIEGDFSRRIQAVPMVFHEIRTPLHNSQGDVVGICGIMRDVTRRAGGSHHVQERIEPYPSDAMRSVMASVRVAAERRSTILILGESGSGKDYLAKYIHEHSKSSNGPFFSINCASVTAELAESELFGHERGAFTGAHARKRGLLELAEGGTLLLNEIGELSLSLQAKLLTFLDTRQFTRVGGEKSIQVDARLIAATNKDLEREVDLGSFRRDLFYRLNVVSIIMPPLRRRREDIPLLVKEIMTKLRDDLEISGVPEIDKRALNALINYSWPGNIRELRNVLERALIISNSNKIEVEDLYLKDKGHDWSYSLSFPSGRSLNDVTRELKASLVSEALRRTGGCREDAAQLLKISRHSLKHYIKALGVSND